MIPPIPSEAVLGAAGRAHQRAAAWRSSRWSSFATLGSLARGDLLLLRRPRRSGPRRSHAFLDRLPLVETEDVDRTFAWFERHGRSAVFFGRHGADRAQLHLRAGRRRPDAVRPQFLLYTAGGSLIWNSVLIGLGVAAGDFIETNLH